MGQTSLSRGLTFWRTLERLRAYEWYHSRSAGYSPGGVPSWNLAPVHHRRSINPLFGFFFYAERASWKDWWEFRVNLDQIRWLYELYDSKLTHNLTVFWNSWLTLVFFFTRNVRLVVWVYTKHTRTRQFVKWAKTLAREINCWFVTFGWGQLE